MLDWWLCNDNAEAGGEASWRLSPYTIAANIGIYNLENANDWDLTDVPAIVKLWKLGHQRPGIYEHLIIVWRHKALLIAIMLWKSSNHIL